MLRTSWFLVLSLAACSGDETSDTGAADTDTAGTADTSAGGAVRVRMTTTLGDIVIALDEASAPITTANFLGYVDEGFFDGDDGLGATTFHRVIPDFVAQGGGYTPEGAEKDTRAPIALESDNGRSNLRATIAMARTDVRDSATSQFFVNVIDNTFLDYTSAEPGYAVFGDVVSGMDVVDAIVAVPTTGDDEPVDAIVILDCERE